MRLRLLSALLVLPVGLLIDAPVAPRAHAADVQDAATVAPGGPGGPVPLADSVVIEKKLRRLTLFHQRRPIRSYLVALGANPVGDKRTVGDRRTPEGVFYIDGKNDKSDFHLALHISYPDSAHRARAEALGTTAGGDILIHGLRNGRGATGRLPPHGGLDGRLHRAHRRGDRDGVERGSGGNAGGDQAVASPRSRCAG